MNADEISNKQRKFAFVALLTAVLGMISAACSSRNTSLTVPAGAHTGFLTLFLWANGGGTAFFSMCTKSD